MRFSPLRSLVAACSVFCSSFLHAEQVIIETDFSLGGETSGFGLSEKPESPEELPLKAPTSLKFNPTSLISRGTEALPGLPAPYARIQIGPKESGGTGSSGANIQWNLGKLGLEKGRYRLTYKIMSLTAGVPGGRVQMTLVDEKGKPLEGHASALPLIVAFTKDKIVALHNAPTEPYVENQLYTVEMTVDMDQKVWSASVDGSPLVEGRPLPDTATQAGVRIGDVSFKSQGGLGDVADSEWALANVKLVKMD